MSLQRSTKIRWTASSAWCSRLAGSALTLGLLFSSAGEAHAAEPDLQTRSAARDLAVQGAEAFEAKDYATALDRFNRATALFPAPSIAVMRARSLAKLGRWVEALDVYANVSSLTVSAEAPEAYRRAQSEAVNEARVLRKSMPRLEIRSASVESQGTLVVKLDERVVPAALLDVQQSVDPGTHTVQAEVDGSLVFQRALKLAANERASVVITPGAIEPSSETPSEGTATPSRFPPSRQVWTYVAFGAGALGFAVAIVSGSTAMRQQDRLDAACNPRCPPNTDDERDSISSNRTLAFAGLAVGVAGVGTGVYLLLSGRSDAGHVAARLTPAGATLEGAF